MPCTQVVDISLYISPAKNPIIPMPKLVGCDNKYINSPLITMAWEHKVSKKYLAKMTLRVTYYVHFRQLLRCGYDRIWISSWSLRHIRWCLSSLWFDLITLFRNLEYINWFFNAFERQWRCKGEGADAIGFKGKSMIGKKKMESMVALGSNSCKIVQDIT